jgi:hypothetical protein
MSAMTKSAMSRKKQQGFVAWLAAVPLLLIAVFGLYTWFVLSWSYSEGDRAGYIQKFSKKGWLCKTWEGELAMVTMPGTLTEKFYFTVTDDAVAQTLNQHLGKKVTLTYDEHIGIPSSCFGDTGYFVTAVKDIE